MCIRDRNSSVSEWQRYSFLSTFTSSSISEADVRKSLAKGCPVEVGLKWTGGGGHAVLVSGLKTKNATTWCVVLDPLESQKLVRFSELGSAYGRGSWTWTWSSLLKV